MEKHKSQDQVNPSPEIEKLGHRIEELNNKCTQVLTFLSFAIAAAALL